jgi:hypothetical protein
MNPSHTSGVSRRNQWFAGAIAAVLVLAAVLEIGRIAIDAPWRNFPPVVSHVVGGVLAGLWLAGAAAVLLRHHRLATPAWVLSIVCPLAMFGHAMVVAGVGTRLGLLYVPVALLLVLLDRGLYADGEFERLHQEAI